VLPTASVLGGGRSPLGWEWAKTPAETIALLEAREVDELSLDHDLGLWDDAGREQTGYEVLLCDLLILWLSRAGEGGDPPAGQRAT
jgi:hypothetical protein